MSGGGRASEQEERNENNGTELMKQHPSGAGETRSTRQKNELEQVVSRSGGWMDCTNENNTTPHRTHLRCRNRMAGSSRSAGSQRQICRICSTEDVEVSGPVRRWGQQKCKTAGQAGDGMESRGKWEVGSGSNGTKSNQTINQE